MKQREIACPEVESQIPLHVGGDLDEDVQVVITRHVASCHPCRDLWKRAVRSREALLAALEPTARAAGIGLWPGIQAELLASGLLESPQEAAGPTALVKPAPRLRALPSWTRWAGYAAAACLLLAVGRLAGGPGAGGAANLADTQPSGAASKPAALAQQRSSDRPDRTGGEALVTSPLLGGGESRDDLAQQGATRVFEDYGEDGALHKLGPDERPLGEFAPYWQTPNQGAAGQRTVNAPVNNTVLRR